jgi:hypothetical protein
MPRRSLGEGGLVIKAAFCRSTSCGDKLDSCFFIDTLVRDMELDSAI